jgi:hypothetical protein
MSNQIAFWARSPLFKVTFLPLAPAPIKSASSVIGSANRGSLLTLVVAQQKGRIISAVSDTGVMEHGVPLPPAQQIPKLCVLSPDVAVGFAGNPDLARRAIETASVPTTDVYRTVTQHFLGQHKHADEAVEFLILFARPVSKIIPIRDGRIYRPTLVAWLGDQQAFEAFQEYRTNKAATKVNPLTSTLYISTNKTEEQHPDNVTFELLGALRYVIMDADVSSAFGMPVAVNNVGGRFEYRSYSFYLSRRPLNLILPKEEVERLRAEDRESSEYAASCYVATPESHKDGVAFHFVRGKLTYLYWGERGQLLANFVVLTNKNIDEVLAFAEGGFGLKLVGSISLRTPPPSDYGIPESKFKQITFNKIGE